MDLDDFLDSIPNLVDDIDPFYVTVPTDLDRYSDPDVHEVVLDDGWFHCNDCGASGSTDGFALTDSGAQEWHDDTVYG